MMMSKRNIDTHAGVTDEFFIKMMPKRNIDILAGLTDEMAVPALEDPRGGAHLLKTHLYDQIAWI